MGEYAIRRSDRERVKIGTCETMYYLRFEDRHKVQHEPGNVDPENDPDGLFFRIPFIDEDHVSIGEYNPHGRGLRLSHRDAEPSHYAFDRETNERKAVYFNSDFADQELAATPGNIQLYDRASGLGVNVACYHGIKLPEGTKEMRPFWNGKGWSLELAHLKAMREEGEIVIYPVVHCRHCRSMWRYTWAELWNDIPADMRERFKEYYDAETIRKASSKALAGGAL